MIDDYELRVSQQIRQFEQNSDPFPLPDIYHYWSDRYVVPRFRSIFDSPTIMHEYIDSIKAASQRYPEGNATAVSIGAGDCTLEIDIARHILESGITNFQIICLELSEQRLNRAEMSVGKHDLQNNISLEICDINKWRGQGHTVDVFIAHHSLHHIVNLESLFATMRSEMNDYSVFITADMIGRNGHMRWPEVEHWINHLWSIMPSKYKKNHQIGIIDDYFVNRDCSSVGFEGIRAQDILPLINMHFDYDCFLGYGGMIDVFIDRGYGHNLRMKDPYDTGFIDFVEDLNQTLLDSGAIKPTMMLGRFVRSQGRKKCFRHITPDRSVRFPHELRTEWML